MTVVDKNNITGGASFINAGYIVPSHFISMAAPGIITKGLKWMLNSSSPFYVKPRLDLEFFKWAIHFRKSATFQNVEKCVPVLKNINLKSRDLFEEMLDSMDFKFHYENKGLLMVYKTYKAEEEELHLAERAAKEGLEVSQVSKQELKELQPAFNDEVKGAINYLCDSHSTPNDFMNSLHQWLRNNGVKFELGQEVEKLNVFQGKIKEVNIGPKLISGDEFVLAAGSWTSSLARSLGLKIPIEGGKGYSMNVYRPTGITLPAILTEAKVAVTPMDGFVRFAGTMEFSGNNTLIRKNRVEAIDKAVQNYYSEIKLNEQEKEAAVSGLRPVSPDGLPFIGRSEAYSNLTVASGHSMMGWSLGPATGKLVSEILGNRKPFMDISPFRVERFN